MVFKAKNNILEKFWTVRRKTRIDAPPKSKTSTLLITKIWRRSASATRTIRKARIDDPAEARIAIAIAVTSLALKV